MGVELYLINVSVNACTKASPLMSPLGRLNPPRGAIVRVPGWAAPSRPAAFAVVAAKAISSSVATIFPLSSTTSSDSRPRRQEYGVSDERDFTGDFIHSSEYDVDGQMI